MASGVIDTVTTPAGVCVTWLFRQSLQMASARAGAASPTMGTTAIAVATTRERAVGKILMSGLFSFGPMGSGCIDRDAGRCSSGASTTDSLGLWMRRAVQAGQVLRLT